MKKYFRVWKSLATCAAMSYASNMLEMSSYFVGKALRFAFFWLFIVSLFQFTDNLVGYSQYESLLVFLTFNIVDTLAQVFFRGIYVFKSDVRRGFFDYVLLKPVNALFHTFSRLPDIVDLFFLLPLLGITGWVILRLPVGITWWQGLSYIAAIILGLAIALSLHILIASLILRMEEGDAAIWLYRDAFAVGRFPTEIFPGWLQIILTVVMPVVVMVGVPARALLSVVSWQWWLVAIFVTLFFVLISLTAWRASLRYYSSASS